MTVRRVTSFQTPPRAGTALRRERKEGRLARRARMSMFGGRADGPVGGRGGGELDPVR